MDQLEQTVEVKKPETIEFGGVCGRKEQIERTHTTLTYQAASTCTCRGTGIAPGTGSENSTLILPVIRNFFQIARAVLSLLAMRRCPPLWLPTDRHI